MPCCLVPTPDLLKAWPRSFFFFNATLVAEDQCLLWFSPTEALEVDGWLNKGFVAWCTQSEAAGSHENAVDCSVNPPQCLILHHVR